MHEKINIRINHIAIYSISLLLHISHLHTHPCSCCICKTFHPVQVPSAASDHRRWCSAGHMDYWRCERSHLQEYKQGSLFQRKLYLHSTASLIKTVNTRIERFPVVIFSIVNLRVEWPALLFSEAPSCRRTFL